MKIAFINIYQGKIERGLETYVSELSKLLKKSHKVDEFTDKSGQLTRWPFFWRAYLDPHGIKIALFTLKLIPKVWKEKYDVIFPLNGGWQPAFLRIITWLYGGKIIIPGQSGRGWDDRNNLWCFPDCFVALTEEGKNWAKRVNPFVRVEKIPNGVNTREFKPAGDKYKISLETPVIICQGALEASKRIDLAIKAVSKLKKVSLLVVGKGSLSENIDELGKNLLGERYERVSVPHAQMPSVYRTGAVFTLPSQGTEAFGISYIEAMSTNLAVVATDDEVRREIIGDAGIYIDPEDTESFTVALKSALETEWGEKPRMQALKFDWERVASSYESLLTKLI